MTRDALRRAARLWSRTTEMSLDDSQMDMFLDMAATDFARDCNGLTTTHTITGDGVNRRFTLPAGTHSVLAVYVDDGVTRQVLEAWSHYRLRDPDFRGYGAVRRYAVESAPAQPVIWLDAVVPLGGEVEVVLTTNRVVWTRPDGGAADGSDDEPALDEAYHQALGLKAAAYAAMTQFDESVQRAREREYRRLVAEYRAERAAKEPSGMMAGEDGEEGGVGITISVVGEGPEMTAAQVYGFVKAMLKGGGVADIEHDDTHRTLTVDVNPITPAAIYQLLQVLLVAGPNVTIVRDDDDDTFTFSSHAADSGLTSGERAVLDGAVQIASIQIDRRDITFVSDGGAAATITVPGLTAKDEGNPLGAEGEITEINFVGAGVTATRAANVLTVTIPQAAAAGATLTPEQVQALINHASSIVGIREFEAALRTTVEVLPATAVTIQNAAATLAVPITGEPAVPAADPDREIVWRVGSASIRFDLSALLRKPAVRHTAPLSSSNAVEFSSGGVLYLLARSDDDPAQFLFSADQEGTYQVAIEESSIDLEPWARRSSAAKIPAAKLPAETGLTADQVDARIRAQEQRGDLLHTITFTGEALGWVGQTNYTGNTGATGLSFRFTVQETEFTVTAIFQSDDDGSIEIDYSPADQDGKLAGVKFVVNELQLPFDTGDALSPGALLTEREWVRQPAGTIVVGQNVLSVYEPLGDENIVPEGEPSDVGKYLKRGADGPEWAAAVAAAPGARLHVLNDGALPGVTPPDSTGNRQSGALPRPFDTPLDLDDAAYTHAELHVSVTFTFDPTSPADGIGFGPDHDLTANLTEIVFLSRIRALADWVAGGTVEGLKLGDDLDVYQGSDKRGVVQFYLAHDSNGAVGTWWQYVGASGTATFSIEAHLGVSVSPTDAADAADAADKWRRVANLSVPAGALANNVPVAAAWGSLGAGYTAVTNGVLGIPRPTLAGRRLGWIVRTKDDGETVIAQLFVGEHNNYAGFLRAGNQQANQYLRVVTSIPISGVRYGTLTLQGKGNAPLAGTVVEVLEVSS